MPNPLLQVPTRDALLRSINGSTYWVDSNNCLNLKLTDPGQPGQYSKRCDYESMASIHVVKTCAHAHVKERAGGGARLSRPSAAAPRLQARGSHLRAGGQGMHFAPRTAHT